MSSSAALKASLAAPDTNGSGIWDPYPDGPEKQVVKIAGRTKSGSSPNSRASIKPAAPRLASLGLSDSLPAPKLTTPPERMPANINDQSEAAPTSGKTPAARKLSAVNPQQYVRELERYHADQNRKQIRGAVMDVASSEVERVATLAARVRGRYIAKLLDAGGLEKNGLKETELQELRRCRESHEELCHGLEMLKSAIFAGDILVSGMSRHQ
ncbi:MAG: hypothetical protein CMM47_07910 [Rhodospirillaceae bacterium]|nr:hypothetical protein [Rhodospirillaceae bacterium]